MPYVPVSPTQITISTANTWIDIDLDDYVTLPPGGASGVALLIVSNGAYASGARAKGWTYSSTTLTVAGGPYRYTMFVGADASNTFQVYASHTTNITIYIMAYMTDGFSFLSQPQELSLTSSASWLNADLSAYIPAATATGAIFIAAPAKAESFGMRDDGSTDDFRSTAGSNFSTARGFFGTICKCTNAICEYYGSAYSNLKLYLVGYITDDALVSFSTNKTDYSTATTGSYADLDALPTGAIAGIMEVTTTNADYKNYIRKKGNSEDYYYMSIGETWLPVEGDGSRITEAKIENAGVDFHLVCWFASPSAVTGGWVGIGDCMIL